MPTNSKRELSGGAEVGADVAPKKKKSKKTKNFHIESQDQLIEPTLTRKDKKAKKKVKSDDDIHNTIHSASENKDIPSQENSSSKQKEKKSQKIAKSMSDNHAENPPPIERPDVGVLESHSQSQPKASTETLDSNLDPEKRRKQKKLKKKMKKTKKTEPQTDEKTNVAQKEAIAYLQKWKSTRDKWNFQKVRQVWLLQHMLDSEQVDEENFTILLEYLEGLQGKAKETTLEKAQSTLEADDTSDETADRIRQLIQILS